MRWSRFVGLKTALLLVLFVATMATGQAQAAYGEVWVSPDYDTSTAGWGVTRFASIQDAMDSVRPGGTVHVGPGTYGEHVLIEKALTVIGHDRPVVDGGGQGNVITVQANGMEAFADTDGYVVTITGLQVQNGAFGYWVASGRNRIEDNIFRNNLWHGLIAETSNYNLFTDNTMNGYGEGLMLASQYNEISANRFLGNAPEGPGCTGIRVGASASNNLIKDNTLENYRGHIALLGASGNTVAGNVISHSWRSDLADDLMRFAGIILWNASDNQLLNNSIEDIEGAGIRLFSGSSGNHLEANRVADTAREGIGIYFDSDNNTVCNNALGPCERTVVVDASQGNVLDNNDLDSVSPVPVTRPVGVVAEFEYQDEVRVATDELWSEVDITFTSALVVASNGVLTIRDSTLDTGRFGIVVESGGRLIITGSTLSGTEEIMVLEGGQIEVEDSEFYSLGGWDGGGALHILGDNAVVRNNLFKGCYVAVQTDQSSGHIITGNEICGGSQGILVWGTHPDHDVQITNNRVYNMLAGGIVGHALTGSVITGNTLENIHGPAVSLGAYHATWEGLEPNLVYYNNFTAGTYALDRGPNSTWDFDYRGNYWWDYQDKSPDAQEHTQYQGVWNQSYEIGGNPGLKILDRYPLMRPNQPSDWAVAEIDTAKSLGLVTEKVLTGFQERITREEFCELAVKLYEALSGQAAQPVSPNPFLDTINPEVLKANNLGIVRGVSDDRFAPEAYVTRQEISVMLYRTLVAALPGLDMDASGVAPFPDEEVIAEWAIEEVRFANKHGIMRGVGENRIDPLGNTTREQAIALVTRMYDTFGR